MAVAKRHITENDELTYLRKELQRKEAELAAARSEIDTYESILQLMDGVFYAFQSFGLSLHQTQTTYTKLTWMLEQEQSSATEASQQTSAANLLFANLAGKIERLNHDLAKAVTHMLHIDEVLNKVSVQDESFEDIRQETHQTRDSLLEMLEQANTLSDSGEFTGDGLARLNELVRSLEATVTTGSFRGHMELFKLDHLVFKFNIYRVFMGHHQLEVNDISDHMQTRLGHWYYQGEGKQHCTGFAGYRELEGPNERLHNYAISAVEAFNSDHIPEALKLLKNMEAASLEFLQHLETLADSGENENLN